MVLVAPQSIPREGRAEVLAVLRQGSGRRPRFDPDLAGGLRAWLEDAASLVVQARGEDAAALHLGPRQLVGGGAPEAETAIAMTASLVHALFRQIVTTGTVGDPLGDAVAALAADPGTAATASSVEALTASERRSLSTTLEGHLGHLRRLVPLLQPGWLPRTGDHVAIPLAGGRVVLHGTFDLLIGAPEPEAAALCAVGLTTAGLWSRARHTLHLLALLETLRSGTPPFRVALLHSGAGRYGVEDVTEEHLGAIVTEVAARLGEVAGAAH